MRIAVFSTYDVLPGRNGGETRFLQLYRRLSSMNDVRIISYDHQNKPGPDIQTTHLAPALDVVNCKLSWRDRRMLEGWMQRTGLFLHDILCVNDYQFTPEFLSEMQSSIRWADVVVVTTPFLSKVVIPSCNSRHLTLYEAHNAEFRAKRSYLTGNRDRASSASFMADTLEGEAAAVDGADIVLAVSDADAEQLSNHYNFGRAKIAIVPNGVDCGQYAAVSAKMKSELRRATKLADDVGVFIGSAYGPNVESYRLTRDWLDQAGFTGTILILGTILDERNGSWPAVGFKERWLGFVDHDVKHLLLGAADFALHIVVSGGGTNLKLFDYMAAGLPILANQFGARGVAGDDWHVPVETAGQLAAVVRDRAWTGPAAQAQARRAREIAAETFDWGKIAATYQAVLSTGRATQ